MAKSEDCTISVQGTSCCLHTWNGDLQDKAKALVLIFHGFAGGQLLFVPNRQCVVWILLTAVNFPFPLTAHGLYPTVRYAAERLAAANYIVVAPDLPGHGASEGLSGYIPSATTLLDVGVEIAQQVKNKHSSTNKFFLLGSSMGGCISLAVAQKMEASAVSGVVLLAPMLMLSVGDPARYLLSGLAMLPVISTMALIPSNSTSSEQQYRDPEKRKECSEDSLSYSGNLRVGSASSCVELTAHIQSQFASIEVPFLLMIGDEDVVVKNQGSLDLMEQSPSKDKTMKRYPALHGLLCEPKPLVDQIQDEMVEWMDARA